MLRNIWIVFRSEFGRRVRTKSFILTTLLVPLGFVLLAGAGVLVALVNSGGDVDEIAVLDQTGVVAARLTLPDSAALVPVTLSPDSLRAAVQAERYRAALILPAELLDGKGEAEYLTRKGGGALFREALRERVRRAVGDARLERLGAPDSVRAILDARVGLRAVRVGSAGETSAGSEAGGTALGFAMGFLIYLAVTLYGSFVMQSVLEEKTNRVVEVMVSSVRPFQLLMGKVLGMGAIGLVQMLTWLLLTVAAMSAIGPLMLVFGGVPDAASDPAAAQALTDFGAFVPHNVGALVAAFLLFFFGGYLLYSSLFAAAGAASEQMQDAQSFTLPIMLPNILAFMFLASVINSPDSLLSVVLSFVPFFSPLLMLARMSATSVPFWQVALSFVLLVASFVGAIWLSARIYRIGILMYGKKATFRDLARWVRYS